MKKFLILALTIVLVMGLALGMSACTKEELIGFDTELARLVAEDLGLKVEFQEIDWNTKEMELNTSKTIDAVWNGMSMLPERFEQFTFSSPYMNNKQVAVIRKSDSAKYTTLDSLKSAKLVAEGGSTGESYIKENYASATYNAASTQIAAFTELQSNASDVAILDSVMAYSSINKNASYKNSLMVVDSIDFQTEIPYGIGLRKGSLGLKAKIDESLAKMWNNGMISALGEKYGVKDALLNCSNPEFTFDSLTNAADKADWEYIKNKGTFIVGYTLFAPIAYFE